MNCLNQLLLKIFRRPAVLFFVFLVLFMLVQIHYFQYFSANELFSLEEEEALTSEITGPLKPKLYVAINYKGTLAGYPDLATLQGRSLVIFERAMRLMNPEEYFEYEIVIYPSQHLWNEEVVQKSYPSKYRVMNHDERLGGISKIDAIIQDFDVSGSGYLVIIDDDYVFHPNWLQRTTFVLDRYEQGRANEEDKVGVHRFISLYNSCEDKTMYCNSFVCVKEKLSRSGVVMPRYMIRDAKRTHFSFVGAPRWPVNAMTPSLLEHISPQNGDSSHVSHDFPFYDLNGFDEELHDQVYNNLKTKKQCRENRLSIALAAPKPPGDLPVKENVLLADKIPPKEMKMLVAIMTFNREIYVKAQATSLRNFVSFIGGYSNIPANLKFEIFDDGSTEYSTHDLERWYPMSTKLNKLEDLLPKEKTTERGNVVTQYVMDYFMKSEFDFLLVADSDLTFNPHWYHRFLYVYERSKKGLYGLYDSCSHGSIACNDFVCTKEHVGNAGTVWSRELIEYLRERKEIMSAISSFDWTYSGHFLNNSIPMYALSPSMVEHLGTIGSHGGGSYYEMSKSFPIADLPRNLSKVVLDNLQDRPVCIKSQKNMWDFN